MDTYNCIIEATNIEDHLLESSIESNSYSILNSKGLSGELVTSAVLIAVSTGTISALTKIVLAIINKNQNVKLTYKGKDLQFKAEGMSQEKIKQLILDFGKTDNEH